MQEEILKDMYAVSKKNQMKGTIILKEEKTGCMLNMIDIKSII